MSKVLIVEDEAAVRDALDYSLRGEGFDVDAAPDGETGLRAALARDYDVGERSASAALRPVISSMIAPRRM